MMMYQSLTSGHMVCFLLQLACIIMVQCVFFTGASVVQFHSSPADVKQGLTTSVTLNCSVQDSAVSAAIIGKRDVTHSHNTETRDVIDSHNTETRDVSQTQSNLLMLSSLVVMKEGSDVASVNLATSAQVVHGSSNVKATGKISGTSGFLTVTFTDPKVNQTGEYVCEANGIGAVGHGVVLTSTVEVTSSQPTVADLVTFVRDLSRKNKDLEAENLKLKQELSELKAKGQLMTYFNARISSNPYTSTAGQVIVFNDVEEIMGNDYDKNTGLFTCSIPGYYHFTIGCLSAYNKGFDLQLFHNQHEVCRAYAVTGQLHQSGSNAATVRLAKGDVVKVKSYRNAALDGPWCSFHGYLIRAV